MVASHNDRTFSGCTSGKHASTSLVCFMMLFVGCDGGTDVSGRVVSPDRSPVAGAKVTLEHRSQDPLDDYHMEQVTKSDGAYHVGITHAPGAKINFSLSVSKKGFEEFQETIKSNVDIRNHEIELIPQGE